MDRAAKNVLVLHSAGQALASLAHLGAAGALLYLDAHAAWVVWMTAAAVWSAVNAAGIARRQAWARRSAIAYFVSTVPICCCLPLGLVAIRSLRSDAARRALG